MRRCRRGGISRRSAPASVRGDISLPRRPLPLRSRRTKIRRRPRARRRDSTTSRTSIRTQHHMAARFLPPVAARSRAFSSSKTPPPTGSVGQQGFVSGFLKMRQRSHDGSHSIQLLYLEVYNETVRDLLSPGRPLLLREDKQQKWFKGKEKVNNAVLFNQDTYDKLIIGMPKYKQVRAAAAMAFMCLTKIL